MLHFKPLFTKQQLLNQSVLLIPLVFPFCHIYNKHIYIYKYAKSNTLTFEHQHFCTNDEIKCDKPAIYFSVSVLHIINQEKSMRNLHSLDIFRSASIFMMGLTYDVLRRNIKQHPLSIIRLTTVQYFRNFCSTVCNIF